MLSRICRCVTCPGCRTRYVMRSTAHANGASIAADPGAADLFKLYCACGGSHLFKLSKLPTYALTDSAYLRGYGSTHEVAPRMQRRGGRRK